MHNPLLWCAACVIGVNLGLIAATDLLLLFNTVGVAVWAFLLGGWYVRYSALKDGVSRRTFDEQHKET